MGESVLRCMANNVLLSFMKSFKWDYDFVVEVADAKVFLNFVTCFNDPLIISGYKNKHIRFPFYSRPAVDWVI